MMLTNEMSDYLQEAVKEGKNIVVAGGTNSGKTTILSKLIHFIPEKCSLTTIQPFMELQIHKKQHQALLVDNKDYGGAISLLLTGEEPDYLAIDEMRDSGFFETAMGMSFRQKPMLMCMFARDPQDVATLFAKNAISQNRFTNTDHEIKTSVGRGIDVIVFTGSKSDVDRKASVFEMVSYSKHMDDFLLNEVAFD